MNWTMKLTVMFGLILSAGSLHAEDKSSGCGLGWQVLSKNSLLSSYTRAVTNAVTSSTSGMTSGTSGCDKHSIVKKEDMDIHYAEANFHSLMTEMAKGNGPYLQGFAMVLGCQGMQIDQFSRSTQKNYDQIFPVNHSSPAGVVESVRATMKTENLCNQQI